MRLKITGLINGTTPTNREAAIGHYRSDVLLACWTSGTTNGVCVCLSVCPSVCHTIRRDAEWRWWNKLLSSNIGSSRTWKHSSGPCHILTHPRSDSADWYHDAWTVSTYRNIIFIINTSQQSGTKRCVYFNFIKLITYVHWTVHHLDTWIKRDQRDATCFIISLFNAQHVSDVNTSILRSLRLIWVISWVVLLCFNVCWCYVVVSLWWCGIRMQAEAHQHTLNQSNTTHEITQYISRKLLRMDVLTSETCWALNNEIIKQVASSWSLFTQNSAPF